MAELLDPAIFGDDSPCFGCNPGHPIGLRLRFEREGDVVRTRYLPEERFQGPPGILHGGLVMTLADELAAWAIIGLRGRFGFTASFEGRLLKPVRVGEEAVGTARIVEDRGRVAKVEVRIAQGEAEVFAGSFSFVVLDEKGAERLLGRPLPEAWKRFARAPSAG